jgi:hypothetical protein
MSNKRNVVLYLDEQLIEKSRELGFNLSRTFENHLKQLITQLSNQQSTQNHSPTENDVGLPGFEPGSIEPKSTSLDQTSRQPLLCAFLRGCREHNFACIIKTLAKLFLEFIRFKF